jgi:outer membrane murein-binding lipoprotein Lpp
MSVVPVNGINSQIASEQALQIIEQIKILEEKKKSLDKIELLIYSRGGDINTAWPLVNTIRNYTKVFNVLVPLFSHSAATLIALGANEILMTKVASLSPIDPSVTNEYNPRENNIPLPISVEDVSSFMSLAKDKLRVGIKKEENITKVFEILASKVHPLALGNVKRVHTQIRLLAKKMLDFNSKEYGDNAAKIVDTLTEKFYSHFHLIFREEGKAFGLKNIKDADAEEEKLLWAIYKDYEEELKLREPFDVNIFLGTSKEKELETRTVFVESVVQSTSFKVKQLVVRTLVNDMNHRLQVLTTQNNYVLNAGNLKAQLGQISQNIATLNAQITQLPQPVQQQLQSVTQTQQQILQDLAATLAQVPDNLDIKDLTINFETRLLELGWVS